MGSYAPYGYIKSPSNKYLLIPDEPAADVVKRIFAEFAHGISGRQIAERLNRDGILSPRAYYYEQVGRANPKNEKMTWCSPTVLSIIDKQVYIGNLVQNQRETVSFKIKKRRFTNPDDWIVIEQTHEPLIERELWEQVQKLRRNARRTRKPKAKKQESIFAGMVFCSDCGAQMAASMRGNVTRYLVYRCGTYNNHGKDSCSAHSIREDLLESIVLNDVHQFGVLAQRDTEHLIKCVISELKAEFEKDNISAAHELKKVTQKIDSINNAVKTLYADKLDGKMPEAFFYSLMSDYEAELSSLTARLPDLQENAERESSCADNVTRWTKLIVDYLEISKLDRVLARDIIESIIVSEAYIVDGVKHWDVTINYKFVGNIQMPQAVMQDTA